MAVFGKFTKALSFANRFHLIQTLVSLSIIGFFVWILGTPLLMRFEHIVLDTFFQTRSPIETHPAIVYIEIGEDSTEAIGRFPWPRHYHGVLIHILQAWGAKVIVFDTIFARPRNDPYEDSVLEEAIKKSGRVYLPVFLESRKSGFGWKRSLPQFEDNAKAIGHVNVGPDVDGALRRIPPYMSFHGETYPQLGLKVAFDYLDEPVPSKEKFPFPTDEEGRMFVNWAGKWSEVFKHYSYVDVLRSFDAVGAGKEPVVSPDVIKNSICLVGFTLTGGADIHPTPFEPAHPGLGMIGNVINSVLTGQFIAPASRKMNILCLLGIGLIALLAFIPFRNVISPAVGILINPLWIFIAFNLFSKDGIWIYVAHPLLLNAAIFILCATLEKISADHEKHVFFKMATRDSLTGLYARPYFQAQLAKSVEQARKGGKKISLISIDVDDFKHINDTYGHQAGDLVLKWTALHIQSMTRLKRPSRETDCVARYGGEEFIVMLWDMDLREATFKVAERICGTISNAGFRWEGTDIPVTVSLGVSTLRPGDEIDFMIRRADQALYRAKAKGKNQVCREDQD